MYTPPADHGTPPSASGRLDAGRRGVLIVATAVSRCSRSRTVPGVGSGSSDEPTDAGVKSEVSL